MSPKEEKKCDSQFAKGYRVDFEARKKHQGWNIHQRGKNKNMRMFDEQQALVDKCHHWVNELHKCVKKFLPPGQIVPEVPWFHDSCQQEDIDMFRCFAESSEDTRDAEFPKEAVILRYGAHVQQIMRTANAVGCCKPLDKQFR